MPIDPTAVASAAGTSFKYTDSRLNKTTFKKQKIAVIAQGNTAAAASYSLDPFLVTGGANEIATKMGSGSPAHLEMLELFPESGGGVGTVEVTMYPLKDHGSGAPAAGLITPSGTATEAGSFFLRFGGIQTSAIPFVAGAVVPTTVCNAIRAAILAVPKMPVIGAGTTTATIITKWAGLTANEIKIEVIGDTKGMVLTVVQPVNGLNNPVIDAALTAIGSDWESIIINQFGPTDATALEAIRLWQAARWEVLEHKPAVAICGTNETSMTTLTAITDARKSDNANVVIPVPGSPNPGFVIAAAAAGVLAKEANNNPASGYNRLALERIIPGSKGVQWNYSTRDSAVSKGCSTTELIDNQAVLADVVTCYHPSGEVPPAYQQVVNIVKLMNVAHTFDVEFNSRKWQGAVLIGDDDSSDNPRAVRPKDIKATVAGLNRGLGKVAILRDIAYTNSNIIVEIDSQNPNRVNITNPIRLSSNINITDVTNQFSYVFGGQ